MGGEREADAEIARCLHGIEALHGVGRHGLGVRRHEIGVGLAVRTANAATELVELREAELVGAVDDDGVRVRNVDAVLDDRRAHQHVVPAMVEVPHDLFEAAARHLTVTDADARLRREFRHLVGGAIDRADLVVHVEHLPAAREFAGDRFGDHGAALLHDEGLDGQPLGRGRGDHRQVAQTAQGQVECARNRRRRQGQHVHLRAQALQLLLLAYPEAVFLVDDDQSEALESERLGEQAVRADHDIHAAARQTLGDRLDLAFVAQARDHFHRHRPIGEPVRKRLEMLLREQRRRR